MELKTYKIFIQFKSGKTIEMTLDSEDDIRSSLSTIWGREHVFYIGNYFIDAKEILWINVEGGETIKINE